MEPVYQKELPHKELIDKTVDRFRNGLKNGMTHMMLNEVEMQFIEMAQGGDGTITQQGNIREEYYKNLPDSFFQEVCRQTGWCWTQSQR